MLVTVECPATTPIQFIAMIDVFPDALRDRKKPMNIETFSAFSWIQSRKDELKLRTVRKNSFREFFPQVKYVASVGQLKTRPFLGLGTSENLMEAYVKSVAEILEREFMFRKRLRNSSGCAIHTRPAEAKRRARLELLERDAFLCHFLTETPMQLDEDPDVLVFSEKLSQIKKRFEKQNLVLKVFRMSAAANVFAYTVIALAKNENKKGSLSGIALGHGCDTKKDKAITQAIVECVRQIQAVLEHREEFGSLTSEQFLKKNLKLKHIDIHDHAKLLRNKDYVEKLKKILFNSDGKIIQLGRAHLKLSDIKVKTCPSGLLGLKDLPFYFYHAHHRSLQSLYFGVTRKNSVNRARMRRFLRLGKDLELKLTALPHPFA
jgi:hypothetical protein